jgi:hypothetical protein
VGERHPVDGEDHLRFTEADAGSLSAVAPMPSKTARSYFRRFAVGKQKAEL